MSTDDSPAVFAALQAAEAANAVLRATVTASAWQLTEDEVLHATLWMTRLCSQDSAVHLDLIREIDTRGAAVAKGAATTSTWLRDAAHLDPRETTPLVKLARALGQDSATDTAAALATGQINPAHAREITTALARITRIATAAQRGDAEARLLDHARIASPEQVAKLGKHLLAVLDPDGPEPRERAAHAARSFSLSDRGDGMHRLRGTVSDLDAAKIKAAIDPLAAPRPIADGIRDDRTPTQRQHDAFTELIDRHLTRPAVDEKRRGERPHLIITAGLDTLLGLPGAPPAQTITGELISKEALHRLACDSGVTRVLTDPKGLPLDVGRKYRTVQPQQWIALLIRDGGCTGPGCTTPAAWSKVHHLTHWFHDGETNLNDLTFACNHCHDLTHHRGWDVRMGTHGHIEWVPPPWVDITRRPRVNTYWRTPNLYDPPARN